MRARLSWRRPGVVLSFVALALFALIAAPHVHAAADNPNHCPVAAAHGPAGAAVAAAEIVLNPPDFARTASDLAPRECIFIARGERPCVARAPPVSID